MIRIAMSNDCEEFSIMFSFVVLTLEDSSNDVFVGSCRLIFLHCCNEEKETDCVNNQ